MRAAAASSPADRYFSGAYGNSRPSLGEVVLPAEGCSASAGGAVDATIASSPAFAECFCGETVAFDRNVGLPAGWRPRPNPARVECPDCASSSRLELAIAPEHDATAQLFTMKGARINAELHPRIRVATVRVRAGVAARPGALDVGATFVVDRADLRALIAGLEAIDLELAAATPRT